MTALLIESLPLLAGAPNGISKLRVLILQLAVRGKLVPQDPEDECAEALLGVVRSAARGLINAGKRRKDAVGAVVEPPEAPYELPRGWAWARVADTGQYVNGLAFKPQDWDGEGRPIIRIQNLSGRNALFNRTKREVGDDYLVSPGDILVSWSATLDAYYWRHEEVGVLNQHIFRVMPSDLVVKEYLYWVLKASIREMEASDHAHGLVMTHINRGPFLAHVVGIPPHAEQHRIVAKVDELMALCDRLEARQADAEDAHARLAQALLDSLTQAADAEDFATSWQRLAEHFHTLFTTESSIDSLKQTLLQLAVTGKLVPQDPSDQSASELLGQINEHKTRLANLGYSEKKEAASAADTGGLEGVILPRSWSWVAFDELMNPEYPIAYGVLVPGPDVPDGVPFVRIADLDLVAPPQMPEKRISQEVDRQFARTRIRGGEVLMGVVGSVGKLGIAPASWAGANIARAVCRLVPSDLISTRFVIWLLQSELMRGQFLGDTRTLAQPTLNIGLIRTASTPLPPFPEQHRIVAKLDQLMALCDQLKDRLSQARQVHEHLAKVLIEQAVA